MNKFIYVFSIVLFHCGIACSSFGDIEDVPPDTCFQRGFIAYLKHNYEEAFVYFKKAARRKNTEAQFSLGVCYENGEGVNTSNRKAYKWIKRASKNGHLEAKNHLGVFYIQATGVEQNLAKAERLFKDAATQRLPSALENLYNLVESYQFGTGYILKNKSKAKSLKKEVKRIKKLYFSR